MENHPITLVSDEAEEFFALYKCVNMVSTYISNVLDGESNEELIASGHLRCDQTRFVENMTKHIYPIHDSSTHLSFPGSSSKNMTTRGSDIDRIYFANSHSAYKGFAYNQFNTVDSNFETTNRNYSTVIHGVENRGQCIHGLEEKESFSFTRNSTFPPLKTSVMSSHNILSQNQIYDNSFSINSQRQTDESLEETGKKILTQIREFAQVDLSLNNLCVSLELRQHRHLSHYEKCQTLIFHEVMRHKYQKRQRNISFQQACAKFVLVPYDTSFRKYHFCSKRKKRLNPELVDIFHLLPMPLQSIIIKRWGQEGKLSQMMKQIIINQDRKLDVDLPHKISLWEEEHTHILADAVCDELAKGWKE